MGFEIVKNIKVVDTVPASLRGSCISLKDSLPNVSLIKRYVEDVKAHDDGFAFLSTTLAKLHEKIYAPKDFVTYQKDIKINLGGGFVDYVEYYTVDYAGLMNQNRNLFGNNANIIPTVNATMTQNKVDVYTYEIGYNLKFVELEKMKQIPLQRSLEQIYKDAIIVGWDLFVQQVAYLGIAGKKGLFNSTKVSVQTLTNASTTGQGTEGLTDEAVVAMFNGIFEEYLTESNMNYTILPDTFLVPSFVGKDLSSRFSPLYTATLREFIKNHNLGVDESDEALSIKIFSRPDLNDLGVAGKGRIVAYRNNEDYVRLDMPYPIQHYITQPNMTAFAYTTAFVGQVSEIQMPYNNNSSEFGIVTYWDFTN